MVSAIVVVMVRLLWKVGVRQALDEEADIVTGPEKPSRSVSITPVIVVPAVRE